MPRPKPSTPALLEAKVRPLTPAPRMRPAKAQEYRTGRTHQRRQACRRTAVHQAPRNAESYTFFMGRNLLSEPVSLGDGGGGQSQWWVRGCCPAWSGLCLMRFSSQTIARPGGADRYLPGAFRACSRSVRAGSKSASCHLRRFLRRRFLIGSRFLLWRGLLLAHAFLSKPALPAILLPAPLLPLRARFPWGSSH